MKIEIEVYKGQTIFYDDNDDKFICDITKEDNFKKSKRGSLVDLRNEIDSFIKQNLDFNPFVFIQKSEYRNSEIKIKECASIRKDGTLYVRNDGADKYGSFTKVRDMVKTSMAYDQKIIDQYNELNEKEKAFDEQIKKEREELISQLKPYDFSRIIEAFQEIKNG